MEPKSKPTVEEQNVEYQKILNWIEAHEDEIWKEISKSECSESYPYDVVQTFELEMEIEGHNIYWKCVFASDRDGEEFDTSDRCEFCIDGYSEMESKVFWEIDQFLADLCYYNL